MKYLLLTTTVLMTTLSVQADYKAAEEAYNNHNYTEALSEFLKEADKGDYRAQFYAGKIYLEGLGVNQNTAKGLKYIEESARAGNDSAQALLGYLYEEGKVVPQDKRKAINYYKEAVARNNSSAMLNLGLAYFRGDTLPKDSQKAISLLQKVDITEVKEVGRYLGDIYMSNNDPLKALPEYQRSARMGDIPAFFSLATLFSQDASSEVQKKAPEYYNYAASQGHIPSQYILGTMYVNGEIVEPNLYLGHAWLKMAAERDYAPAIDVKQQLDNDMSRSESEAARREFLRLQTDVLEKVESPFVIEAKIQSELDAQNAKKIKHVRRRR